MQQFQPDQFLQPLPEVTRTHLIDLAGHLQRAGFQCWLVGGAVRDLVMGRPVGDLDLTTNARPKQVQKIFRHTVPTGLQHGTITVLIEREPFEVTTFRGESEYSDARRPDSVEFSDSLSEDLKRRDFTVNALAYDPLSGQMVDEHDGLKDIAGRTLRTIGRPEDRFFEDGLRPVRACRFSATLEFDPDEAVRKALALPAVHERTARVARERFCDELRKGLRARAVSRMVGLLEVSGLRKLFLPAPDDMEEEALARMDELFPGAVELKLAFWWRGLGIAEPGAAARHLTFSRREQKFVEQYTEFLARMQTVPHPSPRELRELLSELRIALGPDAQGFVEGIPEGLFPGFDLQAAQSSLVNDPLTIGDLAIGGKDLLARGIAGPAVGEILRGLLALVIADPALNTRAALNDAVDAAEAGRAET